MSYCRYPNKHSYDDEHDALDAIEEIRARVFGRGQRFVPLYPYVCPGGEHWHLSSARQGHAACPQCEAVMPAWFDANHNQWVIYAHGDCPTQGGVKAASNA